MVQGFIHPQHNPVAQALKQVADTKIGGAKPSFIGTFVPLGTSSNSRPQHPVVILI